MADERKAIGGMRRKCRCDQRAAEKDAGSLGLLAEFLAGAYSCCQVRQWAKEQRDLWDSASRENALREESALVAVPVKKLRKPLSGTR